VLVAKTARVEEVSRRALDTLGGDQRALGTIARRAEHASVRLEALARLTDPHEITATALKTDYKDVGLAAVERLAEAGSLRVVAARAKNAAAQRRAKALLRATEEAEAARAAAEARHLAAAEARRAAQRELCREAEALVSPASWHEGSLRLADAEARWAALGEDVDPDLARRFGEATAAAREALGRHEAERLEQQRLADERARQAAARVDLVRASRPVGGRRGRRGPAGPARGMAGAASDGGRRRPRPRDSLRDGRAPCGSPCP
jgi:hypothetical protein